MAQIDHSRRAFFRRPSALKAQVIKEEASSTGLLPQRPPWALSESLFTDKCTRCRECISVCEEEIIKVGDGGFPEIDFNRGECTFCEACVDTCSQQASQANNQAALVKQTSNAPFYFNIQIDDSCLAKQKTHCQSCKDVCDVRAISMPWPETATFGSIQVPVIKLDDCTSCGACISICPSQSITINAIASPNTLDGSTGALL